MNSDTPIDSEKKLSEAGVPHLDAHGAIEVLHEYTAEESRALVRKFDIHVSMHTPIHALSTDVRFSRFCSLPTCSTRWTGTTCPTQSRTV